MEAAGILVEWTLETMEFKTVGIWRIISNGRKMEIHWTSKMDSIGIFLEQRSVDTTRGEPVVIS